MKRFICIILIAIQWATGSLWADDGHHGSNFNEQHLGKVHFPVSCNAAAQTQFDRAVAMLHSFWYDEAGKAFARVIQLDPACAMGYWGIAMSHYHQLWATPPTVAVLQAGREALLRASGLSVGTEREKAYLAAVDALYRNDVSLDYTARRALYEKAMEQVWLANPQDNEAAVFYALALISTASPQDKTYTNQKKALALLQKVLEVEPGHPGVAHYIIHSSDYPELAPLGLNAARTYANLAPAVPHALHMPSHIFIRLGHWHDAAQSNLAAYHAAKEHARKAAMTATWDQQFHFMDYMMYAYLQQGNVTRSREILQELKSIRKAQPENTTTAYGFAAIPARFVVERGDWQEAAALQVVPADFPWQQFGWCEAITHFARGLGAARSGKLAEARSSLQRLEQLRDVDRAANRHYAADQIEIQRLAVAAWIAHAEGKSSEALVFMRASAELEDATEKDNVSPGAIIPARELLGHLLLAMKQPHAALRELETVLERIPNRRNALLHAIEAAEQVEAEGKVRQYRKQLESLHHAS